MKLHMPHPQTRGICFTVNSYLIEYTVKEKGKGNSKLKYKSWKDGRGVSIKVTYVKD